MGRGRIARAATIAIIALGASALAGPGDGSGSGSGSASGEIEIEPDTGSGSGSASPEPIVKDPKVARKWLSAAQTLVQKGDYYTRANRPIDAKAQYDNAVTAFHHAIEASDDLSIYLQLAAVEEKLGQPAAAYQDDKRLVDPKAAQKPDVVKKAQAKLDDLSMKIGVVKLNITPDGTQVTLAGKPVGEAPLTEALVLDPGTYTLSLAAVGYQPKDVELKVEAGSESDRKIVLEPVPVVVRPIEHEEPGAVAQAPEAPSMVPLYAGAGATVGLLLIGTITGFSAVADHSTFTDPQTTTADRKDAQSQGRTLARVTDLCLFGAVAAGAFTAYWYVYRWAPGMRAVGRDHWLLVSPYASPSGGGVAATGSF
ncbi:MAG: PEGA domain-containing protein [Acidobacteriota bacterium]